MIESDQEICVLTLRATPHIKRYYLRGWLKMLGEVQCILNTLLFRGECRVEAIY